MRNIKKCCELIQKNAEECGVELENPIYALCTEIMNIEKAYKEENPESEDYRRGLCDGIAQQSEKSVAITDYLVNFFEIFKDDETPDTDALILTLQNAMISAFINNELPVWEMPTENDVEESNAEIETESENVSETEIKETESEVAENEQTISD